MPSSSAQAKSKMYRNASSTTRHQVMYAQPLIEMWPGQSYKSRRIYRKASSAKGHQVMYAQPLIKV